MRYLSISCLLYVYWLSICGKGNLHTHGVQEKSFSRNLRKRSDAGVRNFETSLSFRSIFIRNEINRLRRNVQPEPAGMRFVNIDFDLALLTYSYGFTCSFKDTRKPKFRFFNNRSIGLIVGRGWSDTVNVGYSVYDSLAAEKKAYSFEHDSCSFGPGRCDNYKKAVYWKMEGIGCGGRDCGSKLQGANHLKHLGNVFHVCFYYPPFSEKTPYVPGPLCSKCDDAYPYCTNDLCDYTELIEEVKVELNFEKVSLPKYKCTPCGGRKKVKRCTGSGNNLKCYCHDGFFVEKKNGTEKCSGIVLSTTSTTTKAPDFATSFVSSDYAILFCVLFSCSVSKLLQATILIKAAGH